MTSGRGQRYRQIRAAGPIIGAACLLAACGSSSSPKSSSSGGSRGGTLNVVSSIPLGSLNPAKANAGTDPIYLNPLYAPLIKQLPNGQLQGVLATSWRYIGSGNKTFQLTLRPGTKFSNGQPVNAAAVVASIKAFRAGTNGSWLMSCPAITPVSALTIQIKCKTSQPVLPTVLSDEDIGGDVVAPVSLAHPSTLATDPIGAGEYTLDTSATVPGSTYTYLANRKYFDQSAIHYDKIVVKFIATSTAAVDSLKAGQVNMYFDSDPAALTSAQEDHLGVDAPPAFFSGVLLADRAPGSGNPLASLKVRQALEYAVDRPAIAKTLLGAQGSATDQIGLPSQPTTWNTTVNDYYPYNVTKAKQLLRAAGYPHGFTVKVEDQPSNGSVTQAVLGYWAKLGVKASITTDPTISGWIANALSGKYPVQGYGYGGLPMYLEAISFFAPVRNPFNPYGSSDTAITKASSQAAAAPSSKQTALYQKVQAEGIKSAWYVGVAYQNAGWIYKGVNLPAQSGKSQLLTSELDATPGS